MEDRDVGPTRAAIRSVGKRMGGDRHVGKRYEFNDQYRRDISQPAKELIGRKKIQVVQSEKVIKKVVKFGEKRRSSKNRVETTCSLRFPEPRLRLRTERVGSRLWWRSCSILFLKVTEIH